jgi:hypothetical protein
MALTTSVKRHEGRHPPSHPREVLAVSHITVVLNVALNVKGRTRNAYCALEKASGEVLPVCESACVNASRNASLNSLSAIF